MWNKQEDMSWEEYFVRALTSQAIVTTVINLLSDEEFNRECLIKFDTGDMLFEVEEI